MKQIWSTVLVKPILNLLVILFVLTNESMAWAVILLTVIIRALLVPVSIPSLRSMKKQKEVQPELKKIQEKYKHNKEELAKKQMELFKKHGINPASGCLTQVSTIIVIIALYNVIRQFSANVDSISTLNSMIYFPALRFAEGVKISTKFLYMDLIKPDPYYVLPVIAGIFQFLSSKLMRTNVSVGEKIAKKTPDKKDDLAYNMQEQMLYLMPVMTVIIGARLPSGIALYIAVTTVFSLVQNYLFQNFDKVKLFLNKWQKK